MNLQHRHRQPELMDQPGLDPALHTAALRALERVNRLSRSSAILWPAIRDLARELGGRPLRLLDLATGAGDIPIDLWRRARRTGFALEIDACDVSEAALDHARERAKRAGANVHFFAHDALTGPLPREYDVVTCSLFLHHLDPPDATAVLRRMAASARHLLLVNDLRRCRTGWLATWLGTRVLTRCHVVHVDGPRSVEGAFTCAEALELAEAAGLTGAAVQPRWPWRWLLTWRRAVGVPPLGGATSAKAGTPTNGEVAS
jgi:SAM-dependent methyltransferase